MSRIVWLASYPKSGNTWLRIFLSNFQRDDGEPLDINALDTGIVASDRKIFDCALGVSSSDMSAAEIERARPAVYRHLARSGSGLLYMKIHDAYTLTCRGEPLIPAEVTQGVVYVVRNPLDVAVSSAHHFARPVDAAIERMSLDTATLSGGTSRLHTQLRQRLLSWSGHVLSWLDQCAVPVHLMRYEDMAAQPAAAFGAAVRFLGLSEDTARIRRAVELSSFAVLRQQEQVRGFRERHPGAEAFFRQGQPGGWRGRLTEKQVARVIGDHEAVMRRLGYLPESGCPEEAKPEDAE